MSIRNKGKPKQKKNELLNYVKERGIVFTCILIDCFFVIIWVLGAWITNKCIVAPLALKGVDGITLIIFQWVSGVSTLLTLLAYTLRDLWLVLIRIWFQIKRETKEYEKKQ